MKTHLNFATTDLDKSVAYYRALLQSEPAKHLSDYALFITNEPGLELALDLNPEFAGSHGAHFGIVVDTAHAVDTASQRLESAGVQTLIEREETCCYANQTKVWSADPDGRRWEVYTVHEDTEDRDYATTARCSSHSEQSCCAG